MRTLLRRMNYNITKLILFQLFIYIIILIVVIFIHQFKLSKKQLTNLTEVVIDYSNKNEYDKLDSRFNFLFDRNTHNFNYKVLDKNNIVIHKFNSRDNKIDQEFVDGFDIDFESYKEWRFTYKLTAQDRTYIIQNRHEVDIIDDFMWATLFVFPIFILVSYKLSKRISQSVIKPLATIDATSAAIRRGDLKARINDGEEDHDFFVTTQNLNNCFDTLEFSINKLNQFSVDVAHELKNPLAAASLGLQIAMTRDRDNDYYKKSILAATEEITKIQKIIDSLLMMHRDETLVKQQFSNEDIATILKESLNSFSNEISKKNIKVELEIDSSFQAICHRPLLLILFNNLIQNALKFSDNDGEVKIKLENNKFFINNFGVVITTDEIAKVFDIFMKGDKSRSSEGVGIGLSLVKWICNLHKFRVNISSDKENGTTVEVDFKG